MFQFVPINSRLATGHHREVVLHLLYSSHQLIYIDKQSQVSHSLLLCQTYPSFNHLCSPLLHSLSIFLALQNPRAQHNTPDVEQREKIICFYLLTVFLIVQGCCLPQWYIQTQVQVVAYLNSGSFCKRLFSSWLASACTDA